MASAPNSLVAHRTRFRDQYPHDRIKRSRVIQGPELQRDNTLLYGAVPTEGPTDYNWTVIHGKINLEFSHIFDSLSRRALQRVGENMRIEMVDRVNDVLFAMQSAAPTFAQDEPFSKLPEWSAIKILEKEGLSASRRRGLMERASWGLASDVKALFNFISILIVMRRFADGRNPEVTEKPLPDGSNITHPDLRVSWALHRAWTRLLHCRALHIGEVRFGYQQLLHVMKAVNIQYFEEVFNVSPDPPENRVAYEEFHQIDDMIDLIHGKIAAIADQLQKEEVWPLGQYDNPTKFLEISQRNFGSSPQDHTLRLWSLLLNLSAELEDRLSREYAEDVITFKRIVRDDKWWQIRDLLVHDNEYDSQILAAELANSDPEDFEDIERVLRKIGQINGLRRNNQLLRDWNHKRPWKQLYHILDTTDNGIDRMYREPISSFYAHIRALEQIHEPHLTEDSPSRKANIWSSLFPIHPIGLHGPEPAITQLEDNCTICMEGFEANLKHPVIARLHCNHLYHFVCIRSYWDHIQKVQMNCPLCGPTTLLALNSTAVITPEVKDMWDNAMIVGEEYASTHSDTSDLWMRQEGERLHVSLTWSDSEETRNQIRIARVETSVLKAVRWKNNHEGRQRAIAIEEGIHYTRAHQFSV